MNIPWVNQNDCFAVSEEAILSPAAANHRANWRLLRRLKVPERFNESNGVLAKRGVVVDVESTGLSTETDEVVQLALLPFDYEPETGRLLEIHHNDAFEGLREPTVAISDEASLVTGITDEMVRGKAIDESIVAAIVDRADLVIAHNAAFDRVMVEKHWPSFEEKPWACTLTCVDWLREGFSAGKLDYLGTQFGWFYDGHRALADCEACVALLAQTLPVSGKRVMAAVREAASREEYLVCAAGAPYERKELLKGRGYRWRPAELTNGKVWWTITAEAAPEIEWLRAEVYGYAAEVPVRPVSASVRYSERLWCNAM